MTIKYFVDQWIKSVQTGLFVVGSTKRIEGRRPDGMARVLGLATCEAFVQATTESDAIGRPRNGPDALLGLEYVGLFMVGRRRKGRIAYERRNINSTIFGSGTHSE